MRSYKTREFYEKFPFVKDLFSKAKSITYHFISSLFGFLNIVLFTKFDIDQHILISNVAISIFD